MSIPKYNGLKVGGYIETAVLVSAIVISAALFAISVTPVRAATLNVGISDTTNTLFTPQNVTINVGDTVVWTCGDGAHTTTSNVGQAETWDSGTMGEGSTFSHTFSTVGTFTYGSTASGDTGDFGTVVVQQPAPEFPGYVLFITVAAAVLLAFFVERRLRA